MNAKKLDSIHGYLAAKGLAADALDGLIDDLGPDGADRVAELVDQATAAKNLAVAVGQRVAAEMVVIWSGGKNELTKAKLDDAGDWEIARMTGTHAVLQPRAGAIEVAVPHTQIAGLTALAAAVGADQVTAQPADKKDVPNGNAQ